jgi:hypothetical protein
MVKCHRHQGDLEVFRVQTRHPEGPKIDPGHPQSDDYLKFPLDFSPQVTGYSL